MKVSKQNKRECEEVKTLLKEKENELQVQIQLNNTLQTELETERIKNQENKINKKLEAENQELWDIINSMKKEQEAYKNSIFLTLQTFGSNPLINEYDQSNIHNKEEEKYEENKYEEEKLALNILQTKNDNEDYWRIEQDRINEIIPIQKPIKHIDPKPQKLINNAAGSGSNQDDFLENKNNEDEGEEENEIINTFEEEFNEEGTSGGNANPIGYDKEYNRNIYDQTENNLELDDRVIQGNERRGRQKQSHKIRQPNMTQETGRDSADDYEEEEKIPGMTSSSSGIQSLHYKKREKGKQSQPFGRQTEGIPASQLNNIMRHESRNVTDGYAQHMSMNTTNTSYNRHRQADSRQITSTGDSSYIPNKHNRRKDQKLSAESGGTPSNPNQNTTNQQEDSKNSSNPLNYQYEGNTQGNSTILNSSNLNIL